MHNGAVAVPADDRGEALVNAGRVAEAQLTQTACQTYFGELAAGILFLNLHEEGS